MRKVRVYVRKIPVVPYNDEKEWLWYCTKIIENFNFLVRSEIEGIRIRSSFGRLCVWTEYDQLKMGVINLQKFTEKGLELLLLLTKGLGVGWCVKVNLKIQECILDLMCYRKSLFFAIHACFIFPSKCPRTLLSIKLTSASKISPSAANGVLLFHFLDQMLPLSSSHSQKSCNIHALTINLFKLMHLFLQLLPFIL